MRILTLSASLLWLGAGLAPQASAANTAMLVVDVSASMTSGPAGQTRFDSVRNAIGGALGDAPRDVGLGLETFGHKGKSDCAAIEVLVPPGLQGGSAIVAALAGVAGAEGASPVADALASASFALRAADGGKSIILIADGADTCGGTPDVAAARMKQEDGVRLFVVGFNVRDADRAELQATAKAAQTPYREVTDGRALQAALSDILRELTAPKVVFRDDFNGVHLNDAWNLLDPDADSAVLDGGKFVVLNAKGDETQTQTNMLLMKDPASLKHYEIVTEFSTALVENTAWFSRGDIRKGAATGIYLWTDKDNFLRVLVQRDLNYDSVHATFQKLGKGVSPASFDTVIGSFGWQDPVRFRLKIRREGRSYSGYYYNFKNSQWIKLGTYKVLRSRYHPGLFAFRGRNSKEHSTEFDWFEMRSFE